MANHFIRQLFFSFFLVHHGIPVTAVENLTKLTLGYFVPWEQGYIAGPTMGSAIVVAIEDIEKQQLLPGYKVDWIFRDDYCEPRRGMAMAVDMYRASGNQLHGIIGSACAVVCDSVGLLAASWNVPVVSWQCNNPGLSNTKRYPTFTRTDHSWTGLAPIYNAVAAEFNWNRVAIILTNVESFILTSQAVKRELEKHGRQVIYRIVDSTVRGESIHTEGYENMRKLIADLKNKVCKFLIAIYSYPDE